MKQTFHTLRKVILNPGVIFPIANIFAFIASGNPVAVIASIVTTFVAGVASYVKNYPQSHIAHFFHNKAKYAPKFIRALLSDPLRINAFGLLISTLAIAVTTLVLGFAPAAFLPMVAGIFFSSGSFIATSDLCKRIQEDATIKGWLKPMTNPAVHWSVGYAALGLASGGGFSLLLHPSSNIPAIITTGLGITTTTLSSVGLARQKFSNPASPFMALVHGTAINASVALATGNFCNVANMLCAGLGEGIIGVDIHRQRSSLLQSSPDVVTSQAIQPSPVINKFKTAKRQITFRTFEYALNWPLRLVDRHDQKRQSSPVPT